MLTEFEIRQSVRAIKSSAASPSRKVRMLLKLARVLKREARALVHARALTAQAQDCNTAAHLDRMLRSLRELYEEVRLVADRIRCEAESEAVRDLALA